MQIGIDLGATKIESVVLDNQGNEKLRERVDCPKNYNSIIEQIKKIVFDIEAKFQKTLTLGVCHPGVHSPQSGLVKNAPNCIWIEKKPFQKDLREALGREVFCENDANCFALSEAIDGAGKHYKIVYGIILGSGAGGGLVIDKQIVNGPNGIAGEWGHNQLPYMAARREELDTSSLRESEIESFISGMGLAKNIIKNIKKTLKQKKFLNFTENMTLKQIGL
jgi:fructokinase